MSDKRRARRAKQARRDARRAKKRDAGTVLTSELIDIIRGTLAGHPVELLCVASRLAEAYEGDSLSADTSVGEMFNMMLTARDRETLSLLAVLAELLVDKPEIQRRCRQVVEERGRGLPRWIAALPQIEVHRAVRGTHLLGDFEEILLGARIDGTHDLAVSVHIDHNALSSVIDGSAVPLSIDEVLAKVTKSARETEISEMSLADARAWIERGLARKTWVRQGENGILDRPLLRWLVQRLPDGGKCTRPHLGSISVGELCDQFYSTEPSAPFGSTEHRLLLSEVLLCSVDPLRWSPSRVEQVLRDDNTYDEYPLEVALDLPDLLRVYIPFAHAQRGIRDELTSRTIATLDGFEPEYIDEVLRRAEWWDVDDAV